MDTSINTQLDTSVSEPSSCIVRIEPNLNSLIEAGQQHAVTGFKVHGHRGSIAWEGTMDLTEACPGSSSSAEQVKEYMETIVKFGPGAVVEVYPKGSPAVGTQLNRPAVIELANVYPVEKSGQRSMNPATWQKYERILMRELNTTSGTTHISYDGEEGIWKFRVSHFSSYGLMNLQVIMNLAQNIHPQKSIISSVILFLFFFPDLFGAW